MKKQTEMQLTRLLLKKIGPVDMDKVLGSKPQLIKGEVKHLILINGRRIGDNEAQALKREVEILEQTQTWKIFTETLRYQAQRRMFEESKDLDDILAGKYLLHAISTFEHIVEACKNPLLIADQKAISTAPRSPKLADKKLSVNNKDK